MPDLNTIPETKTDDALAALKAADPAAFDLDEAPEQTDDEKAAAELAEKEAAEKAEADRAAEAAKNDKPKDDAPVDRRKFDGVLGDLRDTRATLQQERERAEALAAELEALKKGPAVDYGEEIKKLDAAWNSDGEDAFEGTHADYLAQRDALLVQKAEADALAKFEQQRAQKDAEDALAAWDKAARAFIDADARYQDPDEFARFNAALEVQFKINPNGSHEDWLKSAHKQVEALAIVEGRTKPDPKGPHDDRNKADAQAAAKASGAPPAATGGVSSGGGPIGNIDMSALKPGQFSKLSKDQQAAALGGADAL